VWYCEKEDLYLIVWWDSNAHHTACGSTTQLSRDPPSHSTTQGPPTPLTGEDPRNHMADKQTEQLAAFLPHPQYTLLGTATRSLQENPGSTHTFMFLTKIQALGLSFPPAEYRVYPGIFKPLIQSLRYHSSCTSARSIPLTPTVLVKFQKQQCYAAG